MYFYFIYFFVKGCFCLNPTIYFDQICSTVQPLSQSHCRFCSSLNNVWIGPRAGRCSLTFRHCSFALLATFLILRDEICHDKVKRCEQDQLTQTCIVHTCILQYVAYLRISPLLTLYETREAQTLDHFTGVHTFSPCMKACHNIHQTCLMGRLCCEKQIVDLRNENWPFNQTLSAFQTQSKVSV